MSRRIIVLAAASLGLLTACGASAPPGKELAVEMIESLDEEDGITEDQKACMVDEVEAFTLSEEDAQGFEDFDDVADKAAGGNERAIQIMNDFQAALASCV